MLLRSKLCLLVGDIFFLSVSDTEPGSNVSHTRFWSDDGVWFDMRNTHKNIFHGNAPFMIPNTILFSRKNLNVRRQRGQRWQPILPKVLGVIICRSLNGLSEIAPNSRPNFTPQISAQSSVNWNIRRLATYQVIMNPTFNSHGVWVVYCVANQVRNRKVGRSSSVGRTWVDARLLSCLGSRKTRSEHGWFSFLGRNTPNFRNFIWRSPSPVNNKMSNGRVLSGIICFSSDLFSVSQVLGNTLNIHLLH